MMIYFSFIIEKTCLDFFRLRYNLFKEDRNTINEVLFILKMITIIYIYNNEHSLFCLFERYDCNIHIEGVILRLTVNRTMEDFLFVYSYL